MCAWLTCLCQTVSSAIIFTISPSSISNQYLGPITLQIGGLTNGETVVVQKFMDANANGVVDSGEWLVQQFQLTDGQGSPVISGVTNINVPGDLDPVSGAITAQLNLPAEGIVQKFVGQHIFVVSSPTGHFAPTNTLFNVTNSA